ncbi:hypothetical protein D5086_006747 [Populus alba]|uniref:Uncharacterized protein n=1 Tax=Populus alba TaxID=43335 RepID=A0ACC4CLF3_POPAL
MSSKLKNTGKQAQKREMNSSGCGFLGRDEGLSLCSRHSLLKDKLASPSPRTGIKVGTKNHKVLLKLKRWKHKLAHIASISFARTNILDEAANSSSLYCCPTAASEHLPRVRDTARDPSSVLSPLTAGG